MQTQEILSPSDAGREAHVTRDTIRNWIRAGHIEALRTRDGRYIILADSLRAYIATRASNDRS